MVSNPNVATPEFYDLYVSLCLQLMIPGVIIVYSVFSVCHPYKETRVAYCHCVVLSVFRDGAGQCCERQVLRPQ